MNKREVGQLQAGEILIMRGVERDGKLFVQRVFVCPNEYGDVETTSMPNGWHVKISPDVEALRARVGIYVHCADLVRVVGEEGFWALQKLVVSINANVMEFNRFFAGDELSPAKAQEEGLALTWEQVADRGGDRFDLFLKSSGRAAEEKIETWQEPPDFIKRKTDRRIGKMRKSWTRRTDEDENEWR